jgi:Arc/MetJ family transcription regulator
MGSALTEMPETCIMVHMRTTVDLDETLLKEAQRLSGLKGKTLILEAGLEALIARESARRLAALGGSQKRLRRVPRRRSRETV